jgi:hypothetical protein
MGRVEDERLVLGIPCGSSLQTPDIRTVSQLSLCIASNGFVIFGGFEEELVLLRSALTTKGCLEERSASYLSESLGGSIPDTCLNVIHKAQVR